MPTLARHLLHVAFAAFAHYRENMFFQPVAHPDFFKGSQNFKNISNLKSKKIYATPLHIQKRF